MKKIYAQVGLKYGLIGAFAGILLFYFTWKIGLSPVTSSRNFGFLLLPIVLFLGLKDFRDYQNDGTMHFWQGLIVGFILYLVLAVVVSWFIYFFMEYAEPQILTEYQQELTDLMLEKKEQWVDNGGISNEKFQLELENIKLYDARLLATNDLLWKMGAGAFFYGPDLNDHEACQKVYLMWIIERNIIYLRPSIKLE